MLKRANRRGMEEMAQLYNVLEETFRGIKIVKAFTNEPQERKRFHLRSKEYYKKAMKIARYDSLSHPMTEIMGILTICLALLAGAWLVLKGETHLLGIRMSRRGRLDLGSLLVVLRFPVGGMADPLRKLSDIFSRLQRAVAACRPHLRPAGPRAGGPQPGRPGGLPPPSPRAGPGGRRFRTISPASRSWRTSTLRIPFGETVAMVGPNGCGKSTLANLIPRFADPTRRRHPPGRRAADRHPAARPAGPDRPGDPGPLPVRRHGVQQHPLRPRRRPAAAEVIEAAQRAHAHRFIEADLPQGYDTVVGTLGGRLSGGQRQRIALARAILRDPAILILDEATSQIDLESEQAIQQALEGFIRNRTTLIITHRLAVLSLADRIVVMQSGRIVDAGTHDELSARSRPLPPLAAAPGRRPPPQRVTATSASRIPP